MLRRADPELPARSGRPGPRAVPGGDHAWSRSHARLSARTIRPCAAGGRARACGDRARPPDRPSGIAMIIAGALCALLATAAAIRAIRGESVVQRRLALLAPSSNPRAPRSVDDRDLRQSELFHGRSQLVMAKCVATAVGGSLGAIVGGTFGAGLPAAV